MLAFALAYDDGLVVGSHIELAGAQRLQDRRGARLARGSQRADRRIALAVAASGQIGHESREVGRQRHSGEAEHGNR